MTKTNERSNEQMPTKKAKMKYTVDGEVYRVIDWLTECGLAPDEFDGVDAGAKWFEYRLWLNDSRGNTVDEWDSLPETYNGMINQRLTKRGAERALASALADVRNEAAPLSDWFTLAQRVTTNQPKRTENEQMKKEDQKTLVEAILANLSNSLMEKLDNLPDNWDGFELRQWIADYYTTRFVMIMPRYKARGYRNDIRTRNLT